MNRKSTPPPMYNKRNLIHGLLCAFFALFLIGLFPQQAKAEDPPITISSFEDLKPYLTTGEYAADFTNPKPKALLLKAGKYELQNDISIDVSDAYFADKQDEIAHGLLSFDDKQGEFSINGNNHKISFTGTKQVPLFQGIRAHAFTLENLQVEYAGSLKGYGLVGEAVLFAEFPTDANGFDIHSALIRNIKVKVNGNIESDEVWGTIYSDNHFVNQFREGQIAAGLSWYLEKTTLEDIDLEVTGNIGSDTLPKEVDWKSGAAGLTFHWGKKMPTPGTPSDDAIHKQQDTSKLKQAGYIENVNIHVGGNIQATGYSHGYAWGVSNDLGEAWVENLHLKVDGDIVTKLNAGNPNPAFAGAPAASGISDEIGVFMNSSLEVNNIRVEADPAMPQTDRFATMYVCASTNSKGWYENLSNCQFTVKGKMSMNTPFKNTMGLGFGNGWSSNGEDGVDFLQVLEKNTISVGGVEIKNDKSTQVAFVGLAQKAYAGNETHADRPTLPEVSAKENTLTVGDVNINAPNAYTMLYPFMMEATNAKDNTVTYGNITANADYVKFSGLGELRATNPKNTPHACVTKGNRLTFGDIQLTGKKIGSVSLMAGTQEADQPMEDCVVKAKSLDVKMTDATAAKGTPLIAGIAAYQQGTITNCRAYVGNVSIANASKTTLYVGMGVAFGKNGELKNSSVFIDKDFLVETGEDKYAGGFFGRAIGMKIDNCDYQINGKNTVAQNNKGVFGGFMAYNTNSTITNTRSLLLNDWGVFVGFSNGGTLDGIAHYVNQPNPMYWSALLGAHKVNQPTIKNSTLLVDKENADNELYRTANVSAGSGNNFVTVVGKKDGELHTNRKVFTTAEKEIQVKDKMVSVVAKTDASEGTGFIAKRDFQDTYWNEEIGEYAIGDAEKNFAYLLATTFGNVMAVGNDADVIQNGMNQVSLADYIHRHAGVKTQAGAYIDLLGLKGDEWTPDPITLGGENALKVTKKVEGHDSEADYSFTLTPSTNNPEGTTLQAMTATTQGMIAKDAQQEVPFADIEFTKAGTFTFSVKETGTAPANWTYDQAEKTITVTVTQNAQGKLEASVEGNNPTIVNSYQENPNPPQPDTPKPVTLDGDQALAVTKMVKGKNASEKFSFVLTAEASNPEGCDLVASKTVATNGTINDGEKQELRFDAITFTKEGTFRFTLRENKGHASGWTYDTKAYTITVVVTNDGQGNLVAKAQDNNPVITNTYKKPTPPVGPGKPDLPNPDPDKPNPPEPDTPNPDKPNPDKPNPDKPNPDKPNPNKPGDSSEPSKPNKPASPTPTHPSKGIAPKSGDVGILGAAAMSGICALAFVLNKKKNNK
ncbi:Spy0128 family protein [Murdochiella massiliensis]|uniref:Spy0128 family protein n=1 Tax=Murdochiella massiliensis TaxID=1673723 RepID=UPI0008338E0A|nr:FctA domain-containing protein [Murdochiella massiliensis]